VTAGVPTAEGTAALALRTYQAVADVPPELWELATPAAFFFRRSFLGVLESSGVEAASYRYLLAFDGAEPVAAAVLSRFTLRLDLLSGDRWVKALRRLAPTLLDIPMVCCGVPASFGQHHLHVTDPRFTEEAIRLVHGAMEAWAEETGTGLLAWKEWSPGAGLSDAARALGYAVLPTLPDHVLEPLPASVSDLTGRLRSAYRRKYRTATALVGGGGSAVEGFSFEVRPFTALDAADFHRGYLAVLDRTPVRLEEYPPAFFAHLAGSDLRPELLTVRDGSYDASITALLIPGGDTLWFALVSKERPRYENALYTLLLQCIVLHAIDRGFRRLHLGQTSEYAKRSVGARPHRLETFIRLRTPWKNRLFHRVGGAFFPEVRSPELHVFRTGTADGPTRSSARRDPDRDVMDGP